MKTITFYSYKGGVGRSLTLSNIAMRLADFGKKVCIIDFDLEAPGLHLKFGDYLNLNHVNKGMVEYLVDFQNGGFIPQTIEEHVVNIKYNSKLNGSINIMPAGNINSNDYWKNLASVDWKNLFYSDTGHGVELLLHLKELIKKELKPDFLLIDSRTGITDISGIAMTLLADTVVTLAANNEENISGIARVISSLKSDTNKLTEKLPEVYFVLTRIPYYAKPEDRYKEIRFINKAKAIINHDKELIEKVFVIHSDPELEEEEKFKINYSTNRNQKSVVPIEEDYLLLFGELTKNELTKREIKQFKILKEVESLIEESKTSRDSAIRIKKLEEALTLNSESHEALFLLSLAYKELDSFKEALNYAEAAIAIKPENLDYRFEKALSYYYLKRVKAAEKICLDIIQKNSSHYPSLHLLGNIFLYQKDFGNAINYYKKFLQVLPGHEAGYNSISNAYRLKGDLEKAFEYSYRALELKPQNPIATCTLAEIYLQKDNLNEFLKNLQLAFSFGLRSKDFQRFLNEDKIYKKVYDNDKFKSILNNYRVKVELPK